MAHMDIGDLGRLREITTVLARHGFGHLLRGAGVDFDGEPIETKLPLGKRIRVVLTDLGPTFVKLGQILSVRPDIVPRDVMDELERLQDEVPPAPFDEIRALLEGELSGALEERFQHFEAEPMASASIAQVHRAVLLDGTEVAVKVQRPGIERKIKSDLHILYSLAHLVSGRLTLPGLYTPVGIVQEFDAAIRLELDFLQEARASARFRQNFSRDENIVVPEVFREWSTSRVLVMELMRGRRIGSLRGEESVALAAIRKLIDASYKQVFEHGFFHGDPHPGNVLVLEDGRLAFLDFGLTGTLTAEMQDVIINLFVALVQEDAETLALTLYRAGATDGRVDLKGFKREIERLMVKYHGVTLVELGESASLVEFIQVAARFRIRLVPEYAVLARAGSILDGIARELIPNSDIVQEVRPYATRLAARRLSPDRITADALRLLQHAQLAVRDVPIGLNQLMVDLERGALSIRTVDPDAVLLREEIRHVGVRVALAMCASTMAVCAALLLLPIATLPYGTVVTSSAGVVLGAGAVGAFLGLVAHYLFAARIHPSEWRRRASAILRFFIGGRTG
jgi:ubiquinone biosynthesis protein